MSEWQPIETAPKDGTVVDIWAYGHRLPDVQFCGDDTTPGWYFVYDYSELAAFDGDATHWMPLPDPPENPK